MLLGFAFVFCCFIVGCIVSFYGFVYSFLVVTVNSSVLIYVLFVGYY